MHLNVDKKIILKAKKNCNDAFYSQKSKFFHSTVCQKAAILTLGSPSANIQFFWQRQTVGRVEFRRVCSSTPHLGTHMLLHLNPDCTAGNQNYSDAPSTEWDFCLVFCGKSLCSPGTASSHEWDERGWSTTLNWLKTWCSTSLWKGWEETTQNWINCSW